MLSFVHNGARGIRKKKRGNLVRDYWHKSADSMDNTKKSQGISLHDVYITHYIDRISGTNLLQKNQPCWKEINIVCFLRPYVSYKFILKRNFLLMVGGTCSMVAGNIYMYFTNF